MLSDGRPCGTEVERLVEVAEEVYIVNEQERRKEENVWLI